MTFSRKSGWSLLIILIAASSSPAFSQDISWTQPYSGNVVHGPLAPSPGKLPNCPECPCETCQPGGSKGFLKKLFGGACEKARTCRREYYYCRQTYHTMYTPPVLPPYCEIGFGYYEPSWRQAAICPSPFAHSAGHGGYPAQGLETLDPAIPAPAPHGVAPDPDPAPKANLLEELENEKQAEEANPVPGPPLGDEKPRYEAPVPKTQEARWPPVTPLGRQFYQGPLITPR